MGLEAYRLIFQPIHLKKREVILNAFSDIGFYKNGEKFSDIYLEKLYDWGYVEVELQNPELHRIAMNDYVKQNNHDELIDKQPLDNSEKISIQIAKPNHENIVDCLMKDAQEFNNIIPIIVINLQTKEKVDLSNYACLKEHFKAAQMEFKRYYPKPSYPIRCRDVFKA